MEGQRGYNPNDSGFQSYSKDTSDDAFTPKPSTSTAFSSSGFTNDNEITQTGFQPVSSGFKSDNEFSQKGFQPESSGFATSTGFQHPDEITIKSAELQELSAATREAQEALQKVYTILGKLGFHPDGGRL